MCAFFDLHKPCVNEKFLININMILKVIVICTIGILFVIWMLEKAPVGYEDEKGFHFGTPKEK